MKDEGETNDPGLLWQVVGMEGKGSGLHPSERGFFYGLDCLELC